MTLPEVPVLCWLCSGSYCCWHHSIICFIPLLCQLSIIHTYNITCSWSAYLTSSANYIFGMTLSSNNINKKMQASTQVSKWYKTLFVLAKVLQVIQSELTSIWYLVEHVSSSENKIEETSGLIVHQSISNQCFPRHFYKNTVLPVKIHFPCCVGSSR